MNLLTRQIKVPLLVSGILLLGLLAAPRDLRAEGSSTKGKNFSEANCVRCHVVSEGTRNAGIGSTPSFFLLAERDDYLERFSTFFERRPHPAFVKMEHAERWTDLPSPIAMFEVSTQDLEDVIAYIEGLRPE